MCSRIRSEAQKTVAKHAVGAILRRRHIHKYVEEKNRETSVAARVFKPQQEATAQSGLEPGDLLNNAQYFTRERFFWFASSND